MAADRLWLADLVAYREFYERSAETAACTSYPETTKAPLDFTLGRLVYTSQTRRRRNRMYRLVAALLILAVSTGLVVVLLANWLSGSR
jgi:hypothetical protein